MPPSRGARRGRGIPWREYGGETFRPHGFLLACSLLIACHPGSEREAGSDTSPTPRSEPIFQDQTSPSGLRFIHFNGMSGEYYYSEMMGSGVGLVDYDNDGDLDLYLVQGAMLGEAKGLEDATFPPTADMLPLRDRLYRNDLAIEEDGTRRPEFIDVTEESGLEASGYNMGVAAGDYDNDGWPDLYVTGIGSNRMFHNNGDGTFAEVTDATRTDDRRWGVSAAFVDYDRDGWLDLYVVNYVDFTPATHKLCRSLTGAPDYCGPLAYRPQQDRLFRNRGDGSFEDMSGPTQVLSENGAGMGIVTGDFDADGWQDLYIANDGMPNFMWMNRGDGTFANRALESGTALNLEGQAEAGMGVVAADYDEDGDEDLLVTHLVLQSNTLYRNDGKGFFQDLSTASGLGAPSWELTGFGTAWIDYDNDGGLDLVTVNGAVKVIPELEAAGDPHPLGMRNQLFRNRGDGTFEDVSQEAGPSFALLEVSRGAGAGDLDNDGDTDLVMTNNSGPARVLINRVGQDRTWVGLRLLGGKGPRDMLGAWAGVHRRQGSILWRRVRTDGSYLSTRDPRLVVGLGDESADRVLVHWPSGRRATFRAEPNRYTTVREGRNEPNVAR